MFVFLLNYLKPLEEVDRVVPAHLEFLHKYYRKGNFICSGPQVPRAGGVILCRASSKEEAEAITREDPFTLEGIAEYTVVEFDSKRYAPGFETFLN